MNFSNTDSLTHRRDVQSIMVNSCLQPWFTNNVYVPSVDTAAPVGLGAAAVLVENHLILVAEAQTQQAPPSDKPERKLLKKHKQKLQDANESLVVASNILNNAKHLYFAANLENQILLPSNLFIHLVCVSNIQLHTHETSISIKHRFSSRDIYSQGHIKPICQFSSASLVDALQACETAYDFVDFITFYSQNLSANALFDSEKDLLNNYTGSRNIFMRANQCEEQLLKQKLRVKPHAMLKEVSGVIHEENVHQVKENASFWLEVIESYIEKKSNEEKQSQEFKDIIQVLLFENVFSRYMLSQCMVENFTKVMMGKEQQVLFHMRSYKSIGTHYALAFIAKSEQALIANIQNEMQLIAEDVNSKTQQGLLQNIVVVAMVENDEASADVYAYKMHGYTLPETA